LNRGGRTYRETCELREEDFDFLFSRIWRGSRLHRAAAEWTEPAHVRKERVMNLAERFPKVAHGEFGGQIHELGNSSQTNTLRRAQ
jgi:hypothetical protein